MLEEDVLLARSSRDVVGEHSDLRGVAFGDRREEVEQRADCVAAMSKGGGHVLSLTVLARAAEDMRDDIGATARTFGRSRARLASRARSPGRGGPAPRGRCAGARGRSSLREGEQAVARGRGHDRPAVDVRVYL